MRTSGSRAALQKAYTVLGDGKMNTRQLLDRVNKYEVYYPSSQRFGTTRQTMSILQLGQMLRSSPFFHAVGKEDNILIYQVGDVEKIVSEKMKLNSLYSPVKQWPAFAQEEWKQQGGVF
jgi:hypothetical protein